MNLLINIVRETAIVFMAMAPYLLFGFLAAGVLSVFLSRDFIERHLGENSRFAALKAALFGVPMPICSCGVLPLAASLRRHGARRGAVASFLASTPQTGVDSLLVTYALLGGVFAVFRAVIAFFTGLLCGLLVDLVTGKENSDVGTRTKEGSACSGACCHTDTKKINRLRRGLAYGFLDLPRDISAAMLLGILISGLISALIPENYFADSIGGSPWAMVLMLGIGIPLYVCSSGSVPIALAFIRAGISPGAALVFLITGPATNAATITTLWQILGRRQTLVFMLTLALTALGAGFLFDLFAPHLDLAKQVMPHAPTAAGPLDYLWAGLLLLVLLNGLRGRFRRNKEKAGVAPKSDPA